MKRLSVPHFPQENRSTCVPAAARMILAYHGIDLSELALSQMLRSEDEGTGILNLELLSDSALGVTVDSGEMGLDDLKLLINADIPVIAAVASGHLPHTKAQRPHAVVIVGFDEANVFLNDPMLSQGAVPIPWDDFQPAWDEFGRFAVTVHKKP